MDWLYNNYGIFNLIGFAFLALGLYFTLRGLGYSSGTSMDMLNAGFGPGRNMYKTHKPHKQFRNLRACLLGIFFMIIAVSFFILGTLNPISAKIYGNSIHIAPRPRGILQ